ncbi:MaoC family dehydratase [Oricola sp.]|uniref:MaoC family dehydratase n=1 Tax=Oricola sp. TaxID=1979950 RepID=UPI0025E4EFDC|nr:MaoC family dehydratase [Oricola sp.]MCI5074192.1 3-alpha,7-alpha,12-alpha-trihydroxy-5-beta-cholest-24-enoyl-CoA hydratase [Oricola sp.]
MLDYETVMNWKFEDVRQSYTVRDTILYALGLGYGHDPLDEDDLDYLLEDRLVAVPTMSVVLGGPGPWMTDPRTGIDWIKSLHGEQGLKIYRPLPASGDVIGRNRVVDIIDKGEGRGALLMLERDIVEESTGEIIATRTSTSFLRGDGGCGAPARKQPVPHAVPDRKPDESYVMDTRPEAALIYRLSGDWNPIHADPQKAKKAGFDRPILHGLCTYGMIGRALIATACGKDVSRLRAFGGRFSAPGYPGETIRVDIWDEGDGQFGFEARIPERDIVIFKNGLAQVA